MINRRTLMAATGGALLAPHLAVGQGAKLKLTHYLPPFHQMHIWLTGWADKMREQSSGEIDIEIFPANQMGPVNRHFDLVRTGVADLAFFFPALAPGRFPLSDVHLMAFAYAKPDTLLPINAIQATQIATATADLYASDFPDAIPLLAVVTPGGGFFMKDKFIETPEDLNGTRLRPPGPIGARYVEEWGGSNAMFPPAEVSDAISKGTIDGAVFSFEAAKGFQLGQSVRKISLLPATTGVFVLTISKATFERLSPASQDLIMSSTGDAAALEVGPLYADAEKAGEDYMRESGAEITTIEGDKAQVFAAAVDPLLQSSLDELEAKGLPARALNDKIRAMVADA